MPRFTNRSYTGLFRDVVKAGNEIRPGACLLTFGVFIAFNLPAVAANPELSRAIREAASDAPVLEPFSPGVPKYQTFRLNVIPVKHRGNRYSVIRLRVPPGPRRPLVWMFSDIGTIQEYELVRSLDDKPIRGNLRVIYPRYDPDLGDEADAKPRLLQLPRPWDLFELHILGVPDTLLQPGEDYIVWFRFEDDRPADLLISSVFLEPGTTLSEAALPSIVGLPELTSK
jgi:hypothetical protein